MTAVWNIGTAAGNKTVQGATIGTSGGNKTIRNGWVGTAGGNKQFYVSLSASATQPGAGIAANNPVDTSSPSVVTPVGGLAPYSYAWNLLTETGGTVVALIPTGATTYFEGTGIPPVSTATATFNCVVTDANGDTATTNVVNVSLTRTT